MFHYGNPVPPNLFIGRRSELRRIASRLGGVHGQSTALIGEPRTGKTSLLAYLSSPEGRELVQSRTAARLHFCYVDAHAPPDHLDAAHLRSDVLEPAAALVPPAAPAFAVCRASSYATHTVEALLAQL